MSGLAWVRAWLHQARADRLERDARYAAIDREVTAWDRRRTDRWT